MNASSRNRFRLSVLSRLGARPAEIEELLAYGQNGFDVASVPPPPSFPLEDEPFVGVWRQYSREVERAGTIAVLGRYLPQLCFPIAAGMSESAEYSSAVKRGVDSAALDTAIGLNLIAPEKCTVQIHPTPAGHIPVIAAAVRDDFVSLLRALTHRNEPAPVPESMGGCMIAGYNNWHRIGLRREQFYRDHPGAEAPEWRIEFHRLKQDKTAYQDRFILMSTAYYSGVPPAALGLGEEHWRNASCVIRKEHECAHYFTRRVFRSMRNNLHDEIVADYCGVVAAAGRFRADWLMRFLGVDQFPARDGGRIHNYRGAPPLSDGAFRILQRLVAAAAANIEVFDHANVSVLRRDDAYVPLMITLCGLTLEELAAESAAKSLQAAFFEQWTPARTHLTEMLSSSPSVGYIYQS